MSVILDRLVLSIWQPARSLRCARQDTDSVRPPCAAEMLKRHQLKALVNERLEAAAEAIFRIFETTIRDYEAIVLRSKQEVDQQQSRLAGGKVS